MGLEQRVGLSSPQEFRRAQGSHPESDLPHLNSTLPVRAEKEANKTGARGDPASDSELTMPPPLLRPSPQHRARGSRVSSGADSRTDPRFLQGRSLGTSQTHRRGSVLSFVRVYKHS